MMNKQRRSPRLLLLAAILLSGCEIGTGFPTVVGDSQSQTEPGPDAGTSNELTGTWVSPCFEFINNEYAKATYVFHANGSLQIIHQVYYDNDCRTLDSTERLQGRASYGKPVTIPAGARAIDLQINGRKVVRTIYSLQNGQLCFGSQSSTPIDGRPSLIRCEKDKVFRRL